MLSSSTGGTNPTVTCFRADLIGNDFIASLRAEGLKEIFLPYQQEKGVQTLGECIAYFRQDEHIYAGSLIGCHCLRGVRI